MIRQAPIDMPLRFPGHYFDPETGLHYNRNRYFSPELGRYLQTDPAGQAGNINPYAYPGNPLTTVDIDGLKAKARRHDPQKDPGPHPVSCPVLDNPVIEGQKPDETKEQYEARVKAELKRHANALQDQIDAAMKMRPRPEFIQLPNGQIFDVKNKVHMGPCISVAVDNKTGKVTYGQNMDQACGPEGTSYSRCNLTELPTLMTRRGSAGQGFPDGEAWRDKRLTNRNARFDHSEVQAVNAVCTA